MASKMCCFLIVSYLICISNAAPKESFDYQDRTCDSHACFYHAINSFGECKLSSNKTSCDGAGCKFIGNSNIRLCINPSILSSQTMDQLSKIVLSSSVSIGSQQLCLYDDNNNVHEELCKRAGQFAGGPDSYCHQSSKKCVMTHEQYIKIDSIFEDNIKKSPYKYGKISYELPYDYTNNILLVVDGTGTRKQFEESYKSPEDGVKGGEYKMTKKARWSNGNWNSHSSNFYEDYRGAKYYWYGPDESLKTISAGSEVHALVEGVVDIVCTFIGNVTMNGKYKMEEVNIDLIGYSRGGYAVMEAARKLDRDGCHGTKGINIRFMGLYDPVSTMTYCDGPNIFKDCHSSVIAGDDKGLYYNDDYKYKSDTMPVNVKHIAIAYGDPDVGSRFVFNTAEDEDDNNKRSEVDHIKFKTTHSGIGGCPLDGDYDSRLRKWFSNIDLTVDMECSESMKADMFIRGKANEYKLPIDATDKEYYNLMIDGCEGHLNE